MCNLSQGLLEEGREEGEAIGEAKGEAKGTLLTTLQHVKKLMQKNNLTAEEAMDLLDVDNDISPKILEQLQKQFEHQ